MTTYQKLMEKHSALTGMLAKMAAENRGPNTEEKTQLETLQKDVQALKLENENEGKQRFSEGLSRSERKDGITLLKKGESLDKFHADRARYPKEWDDINTGKLIKGVVFGDWDGADLERKAAAETSAGAGGVFIPTPVSARVIDYARNIARVFQAGAQTIPMDTATLRVPRLDADITGSWTAEGADISEVDAPFDSVTYSAKKLGVVAAIDNELLEDAPNCSAMIENSLAKACALALDLAALTGSGTSPNPTGLVNDPNVQTIATIGAVTAWDSLASAAQKVRGVNFEPNAYLINPATYKMYANLKDTLGQPMRPQSTLDGITPLMTNQVPNGSFYLGKWDEMAFGLRAGMRIEVSREASYMSSGSLVSAFSRDQTILRLVVRGDWQRLHSNAFVVGSGITVS